MSNLSSRGQPVVRLPPTAARLISARIVADLKPGNRALEYAALLRRAIDAGYRAMPMRDFEEQVRNGRLGADFRVLALRHDVDIPNVAGNELFLAVERAAGVRATYYFRLSTAPSHTALIRQLLAAGFEVGYHFEEAATVAKRYRLRSRDEVLGRRDEIVERFLANCASFRRSWSPDMTSAANHGDWINRRLGFTNREFVDQRVMRQAGLVFEAYEPRIICAADAVVEDVRTPPALWHRDYGFADALDDAVRRIYLLTHERQWHTDPAVNLRANVARLWETARYDLVRTST